MVPDAPSEKKLSTVCPDVVIGWKEVRQELWDLYQYQIRATDGTRTYPEQWVIYASGRKKNQRGEWIVVEPKKVITHAKAGESYHNFGLAIDSAFHGDDPYLEKHSKKDFDFIWGEFGRLCKKYDLEWGGYFSGNKIDRPHCQKSYGLGLHDLQTIFLAKGIMGVWEKCKQLSQCGSEMV